MILVVEQHRTSWVSSLSAQYASSLHLPFRPQLTTWHASVSTTGDLVGAVVVGGAGAKVVEAVGALETDGSQSEAPTDSIQLM